ncbi:hypothetical protein [Candidatus Villigracilis proximus]|uniref:hypothetical protein n=1 Tax=Candidatus Villigracilis proximus TaxID=3140683 RepID=UPI0031EE783B
MNCPSYWSSSPERSPEAKSETMKPLMSVRVMINSGDFFNGTPVNTEKRPQESIHQRVIDWLETAGIGKEFHSTTLSRLVISRQRYWGAPIPMVNSQKFTAGTPCPMTNPRELPEDVEWRPTGESPLKPHPTWKNTTRPVLGNGPATRETDTMDTPMCPSWYHLRYLSPKFDQGPFDLPNTSTGCPLIRHTGGIEHATMHLLYTRFFHKAPRDAGIVKGDEPMMHLRNQGMVLGEDGDKMSKSKGNVTRRMFW